MEGVLSARGAERDADGNWTVMVGDTVLVGRHRPCAGKATTSFPPLTVKRPKDFSSLEKAFNEGAVIAGVVTEVVKGGCAST
jgi:ribosomal protein S1